MAAWWEGLDPVDATGPVGVADHRLRWVDGSLILDAHPDPEAERALGALGSERCACLDVLEAWDATHDDGAILTVGRRHRAEPIRAPDEAVAELRAELRRWRATTGAVVDEARCANDTRAIDRLVQVAGPAERLAARRLGFLSLLGLEPVLLHRLQASVGAALAASHERRPQLAVATAARALPVLQDLGWAGGMADVGLGDEPDLGAASAVLPPEWIATVWGRGLEGAVDGHVVIEVTAVTGVGSFEVVALGPGKSRVAVGVAGMG
ncbi:MAG: hypothetical protein M3Q68_10055, partial [Actinomycetota bacterium]|nr:hypothetical protein [Actinomycetota bacterium]